MTIVVVGLNHRTASVEIREKLTLAGCALQSALENLNAYTSHGDSSKLDEVVILLTCNRLEVYSAAQHAEHGIAVLEQFLASLQNLPLSALKAHLYARVGDDAIQHLMRVTCGLESIIFGEVQILGQVTQGFEDARKADLTGPILSRLFAQAIYTGKRTRTETMISHYTTSVSHAAALLMLEKLPQQSDARVLIIDASKMTFLAAQALKRLAINDLAFMNCTYMRADALTHEFGGNAFAWHQLPEALAWAEAVICATGAPHTVVYRHDLESAFPQRADRPFVIIDIAVSRDVEDTVRELAGVQLYDIDDLQAFEDANVELRKTVLCRVETIIQQEIGRFAEWYHGCQIMPGIKTRREWAQNIAQDELTETHSRLSDADDRTHQLVSRMAHRLANRLLHEPTSRLRLQASEGHASGYAHAVRELFALSDLEAVECQHQEIGCAAISLAGQSQIQCTLQCILPYGTEQ